MKVINPTKDELKVHIKGVTYTVEAEGSISGVPADHAKYWKNSLHQFLEVEEENVMPKEQVKEEKEEEKKPSKKSKK